MVANLWLLYIVVRWRSDVDYCTAAVTSNHCVTMMNAKFYCNTATVSTFSNVNMCWRRSWYRQLCHFVVTAMRQVLHHILASNSQVICTMTPCNQLLTSNHTKSFSYALESVKLWLGNNTNGDASNDQMRHSILYRKWSYLPCFNHINIAL